ncbi:MAG: hypothetical protein HY690_06920 [Chloroflexi bacterium]|nr:hypothetical protein [Chloroflexota bacterium]
MRITPVLARFATLIAALALLVACAPAAAPSPTAPPAKPAAEKPAAQPTAAPAKPAATAAPAARPAATAAPAAKPAFDEKAVADFYKGKTIRIIVGFAAGGGFDVYSRAIAKYFGKYVPGTPTVVVENVPGAASMLGLNNVANLAPKDGTAIANSIGTLALQQLFGAQGVQFDMAKLHYLGVPNSATYLGMVHKKTGVTKFEQLLGPNAKEIAIGAEAPGSTTTDGPILLRDMLGAKLKVVLGYDGTSKIRLALESGEVDGMFNSWDSTKVTSLDKITSGEWIPLVQMTTDKLKDLPNVPGLAEVARTDEQLQLLRFGTDLPNRFLRPYMLAPEVPADRVAALQAAFMKTMEDKEFLADADKAKLDVGPIAGDQVKKLVVEFLGMSADVKAKLQKVMKPA